MNEQELRIAARIWPQHMKGVAENLEEYPYQRRVQQAKTWLGDRYLLAKPVSRRAA